MDKFVVKTPSASSQEKKRSRPPVHINISAKDRARKYPQGAFHVVDGLLFCSSCNIVVDHKRNAEKMRVGSKKHWLDQK